MEKTAGGFRATVLAGWLALGSIGLWYARWKGIPSWAALPALAAFLFEYSFYLVPAFRSVRESLSGRWLPGWLVASALIPYLAASLGATAFSWQGASRLAAMALVLALWYRVLPANPAVDLGFVALVAAFKISHFATWAYPVRYKGLDIAVLADLALMQIAVLALMLERRIPETGYGFLPTRRDWRIGTWNYLFFLPLGFGIGLALHAVSIAARPADPLKIAVSFFGWLWVLSLGEEFLFRGVLQPWIEQWTKSRLFALAATSLLFGGVHLWFKQFPNWKWVIVAGVMGWFCGRARNQAGSIRAAMVTHTLVITTWRAFLS